MPTPIELLLDPVSLTVFAIYAAILLCERIFPARVLPRVRFWRLRGTLSFLAYFFISSYLPLWWSEALAPFALIDLGAWPNWAGALAGLLVFEAGLYAWHRTMHSSASLWRVFHQMHHSAERHDAWGAFWFSPADMIGFTALSSLCLGVLVVVPAESAAWVLYATTLLAVFQHANIRTPAWLGYVVQRPESHSVHHQRGVHAFNYSDLPVFDLLFGTFRNPAAFAPEQGFWHGASDQVLPMLALRDVSRPPRAAEEAGEVVLPATR
jgi:sterol desaturase/sphingolipid hydroxylase (fatty acid hydroxylase superfamily)